ncbi:hypothetical protein G6F31_017319 [Rhizopus arrhizus]|nr:hypothetical protein G6F31_017319 [Rhizopus arrhizus]
MPAPPSKLPCVSASADFPPSRQGNAMHPEFQQLMNQATRLTRSGDLAAATAAIQAALRGGAVAAPAREDDSDVIDVEAWEVPEPAAPSARSTAKAAATAKATVDDVAPPADKPATAGDTTPTISLPAPP